MYMPANLGKRETGEKGSDTTLPISFKCSQSGRVLGRALCHHPEIAMSQIEEQGMLQQAWILGKRGVFKLSKKTRGMLYELQATTTAKKSLDCIMVMI
jgi:hypothetical protein